MPIFGIISLPIIIFSHKKIANFKHSMVCASGSTFCARCDAMRFFRFSVRDTKGHFACDRHSRRRACKCVCVWAIRCAGHIRAANHSQSPPPPNISIVIGSANVVRTSWRLLEPSPRDLSQRNRARSMAVFKVCIYK